MTRFALSSIGSIRHWLVAGPHETPYRGQPAPDHEMRRAALDAKWPDLPQPAESGEIGPFGKPWQFRDPGRNEFVEFSAFYQELTMVECHAFTWLEAPEDGAREARLWAAGGACLWVNAEPCAQLLVSRYENPDSRLVTLPLKAGRNALCVRLQCLGLRDSRILFGLCLEDSQDLAISMDGAEEIAAALRWIDGVRPDGPDKLASPVPSPPGAAVRFVPTVVPWTEGSKAMELGGQRPAVLTVEAAIGGITLARKLEIPANRPPVSPTAGDRREAHLRYVAKAGIDGEPSVNWNALALPLLARKLLGMTTEEDQRNFSEAIALVDARRDCADFVLAGLLRMEILGLCRPEESAALRQTALGFRYWMDEPGNDAMCFGSENHSLLFHGCQLLAGRLYSQERFSNSGLTGNQQMAIARPRIERWLEDIEARGFEEFNSGTYAPITVAAMLNVVDFCEDHALSGRMAAQIDQIFYHLASHAFGGGVISPQGRVYRDVLYPEESGTAVLLAFATSAIEVELAGPRPPRERSGDWVAFLASSTYRPPADLEARTRESISQVYRQTDFQIILEKTPAYLLTSLAVPPEPRPDETSLRGLQPGGAGYQQHLWQATLGRDCHIFVNHPGGFFDGTMSRPGYWHGNGLLPRVRQKENWLQAILVISDGTKTKPQISPSEWEWAGGTAVRPYDLHPIPFAHAHWPADSFDREERRGQWFFGQKGSGLIGLWCSEVLQPYDDVLTGREFRANAYASAWLVICGDTTTEHSLAAFIAACEARQPIFDRSELTLGMSGEEPTRWWERPEPRPS